jgi:hypothetical protein
MAEFITKGCIQSGEYVRLNADEEIFGHKDFINDLTVRGNLTVSGDTRISQIVDFTSESGDISGHVFRGDTAYFDTIIVSNLEGSDEGGSSGESAGGLNSGPIFVVGTSAVGGVQEIVESEYNGSVIKKIKTASDQVDITILAERGDAQTYKPTISYASSGGPVLAGDRVYVTDQSHSFYGQYGIVSFAGNVWLTVDYDDPPDGISEQGGALKRDEEGIKWDRIQSDNNFQTIPDSDLSVNSNGYSFNSTIRVDASVPVTYVFKNGMRQTSIEITKDTPPEIISARFINKSGSNSLYGTSSFNSKNSGNQSYQQTEAKNGDSARVFITVRKEPSRINVSGGAVSSKDFYGPFTDNLDGTFSAEFDVTISGANSSIQSKGFNCWVRDLVGNQSTTFSSENDIILNNSYPSLSLSFNYPAGQSLINNTTDVVSINVSGSNFNQYNFSKSAVLKYVDEPTTSIMDDSFSVSGENASNYTSGTVSVILFKESNGRTTSRSTSAIQIQSFGTTPNISFSPNTFRSSSSGAQLTTINVSVGEPVNSLSIDSVSDPDINVSSVTKRSNTSFSFQISVSDSTPRGQFSINFEAEKIIGEVFDGTDTGTVRGFDQRVVRVLATQYLPVDLGVDIFNVNKLSVTAQPVGGNTFVIPYDAGITEAKQDGTSNLEGAFGIINDSEIVIDNQVITNAGNILDVDLTVEESL